ncbi:hypothetical protein [Streptomyces sp. NPDC091371]|uniref:recombination directionality factor n=1 Tax=Streptomyces sp. NPDC091371 TaxID=3155303 RepID=UPI0034213FBC
MKHMPGDVAEGFVGRFSAMARVDGRPVTLSGWRVAVKDQTVARKVADLLGGSVFTATHGAEVMTERDSLPIMVSANDISLCMALRSGNDSWHVCDGSTLLRPEGDRGTPCGCASGLRERRAAARAGRGAVPEVTIAFRLAGAIRLGAFVLLSSSWDLAASIPLVLATMEDCRDSSLCTLRLRREEFTTSGGVLVTYKRPEISVTPQ